MTVQEALETLGITAEASADETRRAYLRLLKHHKPEVDPEGFRRLREAYELVTSAAAELLLADARPIHAAVAAPTESLVAEFPDSADIDEATMFGEARDRIVQAHERGDTVGVLSLARQAVASGDHETLGFLASQYPEYLSASEREELRQRGYLLALAVGAHRLASRRQPAQAAALFNDTLAGLEEKPGPVEWLLRDLGMTLLYLERGESREPARSLGDRLHAVLERHGGLQGSQNVVYWSLIREIQALPNHFPRSARKAILDALIAGDPEQAHQRLVELHHQDPESISRVSRLLPRKSMLSQVYQPLLEDLNTPPEPTAESSVVGRILLRLLVILVFLSLARVCSNSARSEPEPPRPQPSGSAFDSP